MSNIREILSEERIEYILTLDTFTKIDRVIILLSQLTVIGGKRNKIIQFNLL